LDSVFFDCGLNAKPKKYELKGYKNILVSFKYRRKNSL